MSRCERGMAPVARKMWRWIREMGWDDVDYLVLVGFAQK